MVDFVEGGIQVLLVLKFTAKKHPSLTGPQWLTEHMCKKDVLSVINGVSIWAFMWKTCLTCVAALSVLCFNVGSIFGDNYDLLQALRCQVFEYCAKRFLGVHWLRMSPSSADGGGEYDTKYVTFA